MAIDPMATDAADRLSVDGASHELGWAPFAFAVSMMGLGLVGLYFGDFATVWQRIPVEDLPGRQLLAYVCAVLEFVAGAGLLAASATRFSSRLLFILLLLWAILLKLPAVLSVPLMEATWLGLGEVTVMLAGALTLWAMHGGDWERGHLKFVVGASGIRIARLLFALSLPTIGLSHFFYSDATITFVPAWIPQPLFWAYLTGAGSIATSIALLLGVWPRLAAMIEAAMLGIITLLVWTPGLTAGPVDRLKVTGFLISSAIACGAWVVAESYRGNAWFGLEGLARRLLKPASARA
jgi:uncharacterized membrane protein YphA (DoxX/SURF4 family)